MKEKSMARPEFCNREEWMRRAGLALCSFKPGLTAAEIVQIVDGELWREACHMAPEDAAEIYAMEHPSLAS
jgi:hypothetical protein